MKLIMEGWRDFLSKASDSSKEKKEKEESSRDEERRESVVKALARGGLTQKEAEEWLDSKQSTVELEEGFFERLHSQARIDSLVGTIRNATEEGMSPKKIEARLLDQGANFEEVMAALDQAFQEELSGEKLEEGVFDFLRGSSSKQKSPPKGPYHGPGGQGRGWQAQKKTQLSSQDAELRVKAIIASHEAVGRKLTADEVARLRAQAGLGRPPEADLSPAAATEPEPEAGPTHTTAPPEEERTTTTPPETGPTHAATPPEEESRWSYADLERVFPWIHDSWWEVEWKNFADIKASDYGTIPESELRDIFKKWSREYLRLAVSAQDRLTSMVVAQVLQKIEKYAPEWLDEIDPPSDWEQYLSAEGETETIRT